jgi:hypothetical protein
MDQHQVKDIVRRAVDEKERALREQATRVDSISTCTRLCIDTTDGPRTRNTCACPAHSLG